MMSAIRSKDTKPELALRRALFAKGLRYRLHDKRLPGRPDVVFPAARVAVFVDGDFWHGFGWKERGLTSVEDQFPSNRVFWVTKLHQNMARDLEVNKALDDAGWQVIRIRESELKADVAKQVLRVTRTVSRSVKYSRYHRPLGIR